MNKKILNSPHDISKKLLIILGISKINFSLSILLVIIAHSLACANIELIFPLRGVL